MQQTALRFVELAGSTGEITVPMPPIWEEAPSAAVWVEDLGPGSGAIELELTCRQQGGAVPAGLIVVASQSLAGTLLEPTQQLPRSRMVAQGNAAGTQAWTVRARAQGAPVGDRGAIGPGRWRVGLGVGRSASGPLFERGPIWGERQLSGTVPNTVVGTPGERWLGAAVVAGPAGASISLPWTAGTIVIPPSSTYQQRYTPQDAPICPLAGVWATVIGGNVLSWTLISGF